ncbi:MAG: hypothetical protein EZS28_015819 [Streblomastix strix]|uniref:Uncharacterized protein n=1 Tax=Streblomastix strix TaxID=222440 RepID=A0A5J4W2G8_9EUKA|nr:MAG: hypothetical protein EZS28_015819 [Streblomastix strix]
MEQIPPPFVPVQLSNATSLNSTVPYDITVQIAPPYPSLKPLVASNVSQAFESKHDQSSSSDVPTQQSVPYTSKIPNEV